MRGTLEGFFSTIKTKKSVIVGLVGLQFLILVLLIGTLLFFQLRIVADAQGIIAAFDTANFDPGSLQDGIPLLEDPDVLVASYSKLRQNVLWLIVSIFVFFSVVNGSLWVVSHFVLGHKGVLKMWKRYFLSACVGFIPFILLCYFFLDVLVSKAVDPAFFEEAARALGYLFVLVYAGLMFLFAHIHEKVWEGVKRQKGKLTRGIGILLLGIVFLALSLILVNFGLRFENLFIMIVTLMVSVTVMVMNRLFWIYESNN